MHWLEIITVINFLCLLLAFVLVTSKAVDLPSEPNHPINILFCFWIGISVINWVIFAIWAVVTH